jgi:hypothetical protein
MGSMRLVAHTIATMALGPTAALCIGASAALAQSTSAPTGTSTPGRPSSVSAAVVIASFHVTQTPIMVAFANPALPVETVVSAAMKPALRPSSVVPLSASRVMTRPAIAPGLPGRLP